MEQQDSAVSRRRQREWNLTEKPPQPLPPGTRVSEVFAQTKQQLLILGEPGSGKTTTMLELARDLLEKAKADNTQPIPVFVSLSSWKQPEVGIFEWLVAELKAKYGLRQDIGQKWMQNRVLLPLLDGLDEVTPSLQQKCAEAMNAWLTGDLENRPCGVLICCRREEFETVVRQKLDLQGAIYLQALTSVQIEEYLAGFELRGVWETLGEDAALRELLTTPLFLSMFGLVQVQGKFELALWQAKATSEAKIEYLFDTYWDAVMSRDLIFDPHEKKLGWRSKTYKTKPLPERKVVRRTLVFVAQGMERDPSMNTEFSIEKMQFSWLSQRRQKIILTLLVWLLSILMLCLIIGLLLIFILELNISIFFGSFLAISYYLFLIKNLNTETFTNAIIEDSLHRDSKPLIALVKSKYRNIHIGYAGVLIGSLIIFCIHTPLDLSIGFSKKRLIESFTSICIAVPNLLICEIIHRLFLNNLKFKNFTKKRPNEDIKNSLRDTIVVIMTTVIVTLPLKTLLETLLTI